MRWNAGGNERARGRRTREREKDRSAHRAAREGDGGSREDQLENCSPTPLGQSARRRVEALSIERVYAERLVAIAAEIGGLVD